MLSAMHVIFLFFLIVLLTTDTTSKKLDFLTWFFVYTTGLPVVVIDLYILGKKLGNIKKKKVIPID